LGGGPNLEVLPPIPGQFEISPHPELQDKNKTAFKVVYSGNLDLYGPMLLEALREFKDHPEIQFQVRGSNPNWPEEAKKEMRDAGLWLKFAPRPELDSWLRSVHAFLIPMVFEEKHRRRMMTSFPSKLIEFAQFGRPIIVWGPDYSSVVQWGDQNENALCVKSPDVFELKKQLEFLCAIPNQKQKYAEKSIGAAESEFNPSSIQAIFLNMILKVSSTRR
jgi:glycosyltransferase involved in cell wall biosynthesis